MLLTAIALAYWNIGGYFISLDDLDYITKNIHVTTGLTKGNFVWAFTNSYQSNWHPLTWLSHMADCQLYGLDPRGHRLTNVLFHAINTVLLFLLLLKITGARWQSAFVAALFALHPLHVESVAWIAERKDVLSGMFWMLTLLGYAYYAERPNFKRYLLTLFAFALGLMAKPMLVTLPVVMLLLDYWPLKRTALIEAKAGDSGQTPGKTKAIKFPLLIIEKIPFFVLAAASSAITIYAQKSGGAVIPMKAVPAAFRSVNASISYVTYIGQMFWPARLAVFYPLPFNLTIWQGLAAGALLLAVTVGAVMLARKAPYFLTGWLWYLITLLPVIGFIQVGLQARADRYTYLPLIGIFIIIAWGVPALLATWKHRKGALTVLAAIILLACALATRHQVAFWESDLTLFRHAADVTNNNYVAYKILGYDFLSQKKYDEAASNFSEALRSTPEGKDAEALSGMGFCLMALGKTDEAIAFFQKAINIKPDHINALLGLGNSFLRIGRVDDAIGQFSKAAEIDPNRADVQYSLARALGERGRTNEAIQHFEAALQLDPDLAEAHYDLGVSLLRVGRLDEAIYHFEEAVSIKPDFGQARSSLQAALLLKKEPSHQKK